jgi:hypothetical protein
MMFIEKGLRGGVSMIPKRRGFQWLTEKEEKNFDPLKIDPLGSKGYFVKCDFDYSDISIHDHHNDFH